jgi:predicted PurR-regulated permease PerM
MIEVQEIAIDKVGGYIYSRTLLAAVAATVSWVALMIIGVPFAVPLAIWLGVLSQFVPVVGTYIGGILPILIALLESPGKALWVAGFIALYQQFENYIVAPRITSRTMSLHPAVAFGSAIVGATLLGAPGALMALPMAATIQAGVSTYIERHELIESELIADAALDAEEAEQAAEEAEESVETTSA